MPVSGHAATNSVKMVIPKAPLYLLSSAKTINVAMIRGKIIPKVFFDDHNRDVI
jgi:hypothetical protein